MNTTKNIKDEDTCKKMSWHEKMTWGCFFVPLLGWIGVVIYGLFFFLPWWGAIPLGFIVGIFCFCLAGFEGGSSVLERGIGATIGLVMVTIFCVTVLPQAREKARMKTCTSHLKQINRALQAYSKDHNGRLPSANHWRGAILPYLSPQEKGTVFSCPSSTATEEANGDESDYVMPIKASHAKISLLSARTPIVYESMPSSHRGKPLALFADGKVWSLIGGNP
jgi:hypothetical protein